MNTTEVGEDRGLMSIADVRTKAASMGDIVYEILELIEKGFMENKSEILSQAADKERRINDMEKLLTKNILEMSGSSRDKSTLVALEQMVEIFERMGDEAIGLIERIEIKVQEKLLFSDRGVEQFNETYHAMKDSVSMLREFLKNPSDELKKKIVDNGFHVKDLVERYRKEHTERLLNGLCTPMGANMYFDMLDFTGNLARHASTIAKLF